MRKLTLKKETVVELGSDDLAAVVGGGNTEKLCISGIVSCLPTRECPTYDACFTTHGCG